MKKLPLNIACLLFLATNLPGLSISVSAQDETQLSRSFTDYARSAVHETVFVHCDKDLFLTGEICWFKLYCMDADLHRPLSLSKLAYWELLDGQNKPVAQLKIALQDGFGNGSYVFPGDLRSGIYKIRCYTNWMKNFDPAFYFEKEITVINPHQFDPKDSIRKEQPPTVRFYPEGGNLVNRIRSTVAFKIYGPNGKGINGRGYLVDDLNDTLQPISTFRMGIGQFVFIPETKRSYKAIINLPNSNTIAADLPAAYEEGYVMHLSDLDTGRLKIDIQTSGGRPSTGLVYLFVHTRASVRVVQGSPISNNQASFIVDKARLDDGISHFTVFDSDKKPVCERLYFRAPGHDLTIRVESDKDSYSTREKIEATIHSSADTSARPANLSMAVYKIDGLQAADKMNIENYLWLSADLPEAVDSPDYYFKPSNFDRATAIDNLMLTQGWRRFRWGDVLSPQKPAFRFLPEYTGHIIEARIFDSATKTAARNQGVFVASPGVRPVFNAAGSDSTGMLRFDMKDFYTDGQLFISTSSPDDTILSIAVRSPFSDVFSRKPLSAFSFSPMDSAALAGYYKDVVVQREYGSSRPVNYLIPTLDTLPFFGKPDVSYRLDDYVRFTTMEEVLREYVMQTDVRYRDGQFQVSVWDRRRPQTLLEPAPLVLLDGVPTEINKVIAYDPLKVKRLDVVTETYYYGNMAFGGILSFVTYNGDMPGFDLDPHTIVMDYAGLEAQREFYSPAYNTREELQSRLPDFRRLLYWQPTVVTDWRGESMQHFFSSDVPGKYVLVVQGVSPDGKIGYGLKEIVVRGR